MPKVFSKISGWRLGLWVLLGDFLRFWQLGEKPPWTDEFATVLYARGDDYSQIPINEIISSETLLKLFEGYPRKGLGDVAQLLIQQNNHPPLYFMGVNLWQRLFPLDGGYISIYAVRSLSVIFGLLCIPAIYWVAKQAFRSEPIAQISAALMAFSPFAIYLSQEARHYTLIILWAIASLGFCLQAIRHLEEKKSFSPIFVVSWILLNVLGLQIHYFSLITLAAEAIAFLWLIGQRMVIPTKTQWLQLGAVVLGVGIFGLIWKTQVLPDTYGNTMTDWIRLTEHNWFTTGMVIASIIYVAATMIFVLPFQVNNVGIIVLSSIMMLAVGFQLIRWWQSGIQSHIKTQEPLFHSQIFFLNRMAIATWGIFILLTFGFGINISRGARYSFVYFPALILSFSVGISYFGQRDSLKSFLNRESKIIALILSISFLGGFFVANDWAYRKAYQPRDVIQEIQLAQQPTLILTPHKSTVQIGEMMGIAWEGDRHTDLPPISFGLVPYQEDFNNYLPDLNRLIAATEQDSFKLWLVNFSDLPELDQCQFDQRSYKTGYYSNVFSCTKK